MPMQLQKVKLEMLGYKFSTKEIIELLHSKHPFLNITGDYKNTFSKSIFLCTKCGTEFKNIFYSIMRSEIPCPHCRKEQRDNKYKLDKKIKLDNILNKEYINNVLLFFRFCPVCDKKIYHSNFRNCKIAIDNKRKCNSCSQKEVRQKYSNPMTGKTVYSVWLEKYGKDVADTKKKNCESKRYNKSILFLNTLSDKEKKEKWGKSGELNPFYNKHHTEETNEILRIKNTGKSCGEKNGMYGVPSPKGAGHGWSGWYKNYFFRSMLELKYLYYLIDNNINFESCENKIKIPYVFNNINKTYTPDFYLNDTKDIIEVKPEKLKTLPINIIKFESTLKTYGDKFKVISENDFNLVPINKIIELYKSNEIKFIDRVDKKFKEKYIRT